MRDVQGLKQSQIAVITPWREQVWRVREALRKAKLGGVDVGNVETYQGREFRITIISTVRSSKRFVETDHKANMGFIFERKRSAPLPMSLGIAETVQIQCSHYAGKGTFGRYWKRKLPGRRPALEPVSPVLPAQQAVSGSEIEDRG